MTIGPSFVSDVTDETNRATILPEAIASDPKEHRKLIPLLWIPATIGIGLLIAAIYLGGRIVTARLHTRPASTAQSEPLSIPVVRAPSAVAARPLSLPLKKERKPALPAALIAPQPGARYIQVGALNMEYARRFIQRLRAEQQLDPHLAPGPNSQSLRVLIGPFQNRDALIEQQTQLQKRGIKSFVRKY